jgi:hypothetical protein
VSERQKELRRSNAEPNGRRVGAIEVNQDLSHLQRSWKAQRVGWTFMLILVLAAFLGLFGKGPLASARVGDAGDPLRLEYDRLARHASLTRLRIFLAPGAVEGGKARVWIGREYLQGVEIEQITPEPEGVASDGRGLIYVFPIAGSAQPTVILFVIQPDEYGYRSGEIGLPGRPRLRFAQFVFP